MKINCLCCGHKVDLGGSYDEFEGLIKCLCGALLEIKTEDCLLKFVKMKDSGAPPASKPKRGGGGNFPLKRTRPEVT